MGQSCLRWQLLHGALASNPDFALKEEMDEDEEECLLFIFENHSRILVINC
jgi:hypothetical protein